MDFFKTVFAQSKNIPANESPSVQDYENVKLLGSGSFGEVYEVRRMRDDARFAKKTVQIKVHAVNPEDIEKAKREGNLLIGCDHPYMVKYYHMFIDSSCLYFIMELCVNNSMNVYCRNQYPDQLPEPLVWKWTLQLALALEHLHLKRLIHRDIKPENVLINEVEDCKLADFGLVYHQNIGYTSNQGSFIYLSPELLKNHTDFSDKSDMWAMGCVVHYMCSYQHPFPEILRDFVMSMEQQERAARILEDRNCKKLQILIDELLCHSTSSRLSALQLLQTYIFEVVEVSYKLNVPSDQMERFYDSFTFKDLNLLSNENENARPDISSSKDVSQISALPGTTGSISQAWEYTLIRLAARNAKTECVEKLLKLSPSLVNAENYNGFTPIYWAVRYGHWNVVEILLQNGATVDAKKNDGSTTIHYAAFCNNPEIVVKLLQQCPSLVNMKNEKGLSAVHIAVQNGHLHILEILMKNRANIEEKTNYGWTPIHFAAFHGKNEIVETLLQQSPTLVDMKNDKGWSALHIAAEAGHLNTVEILMRHGASVDIKNNNGWTPIHSAAFHGQTEIIEKLLQQSPALVDIKNDKGWTALHQAAQNGRLAVVEVLLNYGAKVDLCNKLDSNPLHIAASNGKTEIVDRLLQVSPEIVDMENFNGYTALHYSVEKGYLNVLQVLLKYGASIHVKNKKGETALQVAERLAKTNFANELRCVSRESAGRMNA
jgi:ankyrin repeat protein